MNESLDCNCFHNGLFVLYEFSFGWITSPEHRSEAGRTSSMINVAFSCLMNFGCLGGSRVLRSAARGYSIWSLWMLWKIHYVETFKFIHCVEFIRVLFFCLRFIKYNLNCDRDAEILCSKLFAVGSFCFQVYWLFQSIELIDSKYLVMLMDE